VALVDLLKSIGIEPDGVIGHSVGELGCAYADGTFNADQAILAAFWRGRSILESKLPQGSMAAVGKLYFCQTAHSFFYYINTKSVLKLKDYLGKKLKRDCLLT
jgi:malonyl CoA-acyl carrier protein transacylase